MSREPFCASICCGDDAEQRLLAISTLQILSIVDHGLTRAIQQGELNFWQP